MPVYVLGRRPGGRRRGQHPVWRARPGGRIAFLDASPPENPIIRFGHGIYFNRIVPVIGGLLSEGRAYKYLPKSVAYLPPWPELRAQLEAAGFVDIERKVFTGAHLFTATRGA